MKKIFTLISVALAAMSVNAQEAEVWKASSIDVTANVTESANTTATLKKVTTTYNLKDGAQPTEDQVKADATAALELNDYTFTATTTNVTLTAVSTPNAGTEAKDRWKFAGNDNVKLNSTNLGEECLVEFDNQYLVAGNGNPSLAAYEYYFTDSEGKEVGPRYYETFWTPGCDNVPLKGCYYKFNAKTDGILTVGFFLNKNLKDNPFYVIDGSTKSLLATDAVGIAAFRQNCNYEVEKGNATHLAPYTLNDNRLVQNEIMGTDTNRPLHGYAVFGIDANKDYYMLSPKSQMGIYGFQFVPTGEGSAISTVKTAAEDADAPVYNLAGQKVDKSFKGVVVKNGKKMIQK